MESHKRKLRKSVIGIVILLLASIGLGSYSIYNYSEYKKLNSDIKEINNKYTELSKDVKYEKENQKLITDDLDSIKNVEENIKNTKEEVFKLAKALEEKIQNKETNYKIAYITFDDGPYYLTYSVLKTLKENKVKATFFTIGLGKENCFDNASEDCTKLYEEIVKNGHTIANHTYSHLIFNGLYNSANSFIEQIKKQEENIKERTGAVTNITRFPGGSATAGYLKNGIIEKLRENGYGWVDWTAADGDGGNLTSSEVAWKNFTGSINEDIEVILFHDYSKITLSILPEAIKYLEDKNYILLPLFYESVAINK